MRSFEFARVMENNEPVDGTKAFPDAELPVYKSKYAAGADFFCAEDVEIPSIWVGVANVVLSNIKGLLQRYIPALVDSDVDEDAKKLHPTLVHTGIKACMLEDEVLMLYNRSSNPKGRGLVLANGVGVIDKDYYNNISNDGEIMFMFWNFKPWKVKIEKGESIGQGVFHKFLRPEIGLKVLNDSERRGGFGSTGK